MSALSPSPSSSASSASSSSWSLSLDADQVATTTTTTSSSGSSSSGSSSGSRTSIETPRVGGQSIRIGDKDRDSSGDTCSFYRLETGASCRKARSCYDCLNTLVSGEREGCVLTPQGFCQTMDRYDYTSDFRRNFSAVSLANSWYNFYPSINSTYCQPRDAACARCQKLAESETTLLELNTTVSSNSTNEEEARQFCRGSQGCVCVVACEYSKWNTTVAEDCSDDVYVPTEIEGYHTYFPIFVILQMVLLGTLLYRRRVFARNRNRSRAVAEGPYNDVRAISSPSNRLRLSGWTAGRQEQIQQEKNPRGYQHLDSPRRIQLTEEPQQVPSDTEQPSSEETETSDGSVKNAETTVTAPTTIEESLESAEADTNTSRAAQG